MISKVPRTAPVCHRSRREGESGVVGPQKRSFLCAPYVADEDQQGRYRPVQGISQCPRAARGDRCRLRKHCWRDRKTGPCVPLRVMYCRTHDQHFTIYPLAYVPYSRKRIAPVDLAGHPVRSSSSKKRSTGRTCWEGSWFRSYRRRRRGTAVAVRAGRGPNSIPE